MSVVVVILFLALDLALVIGALFFLSRRRAMSDITDQRYRNRHKR